MLSENCISPVPRRLTQLVKMRVVQSSKWETFTHMFQCSGTVTRLIGADWFTQNGSSVVVHLNATLRQGITILRQIFVIFP